MVEFEWDPSKEARNINKHKVSFTEAATVFWDVLAATFDDPQHSSEEERYITVGVSNRFRWILVSHTDRGDTIRIISARELKPAERKFYERERNLKRNE